LGEGKFGVVYRAVHKPTGWLFAIKKVPKQMITSHLMIDQFILELKLQAYLNHENILTLYTQFDDKSHIYIVL
jgi:serine/threonine protein kinase